MKVLTFGEIMLRLRAPGHERFFQSNIMETTFGGGEANVAVSLANYGMDAQYCTVLPDNAIGDDCVKELRRFGVDVSKVQRGPGRMGIYFLENGANQLPVRWSMTVPFLLLRWPKPVTLTGTRCSRM